nr:S41 family peptidase [uncultured Dyadobacter sp.]
MKNLSAILLCLLCIWNASAQTAPSAADFNLDFEQRIPGQKLPRPWVEWGKGYGLSTDTTEKQQGKASLRIQSPEVMDNIQFGSAANAIPANYRGKEIELRGYMKFKGVDKGWVGLVLRIDGASAPLQFNNMQDANIRGTQDWKQYNIKLPYPSGAKTIHVGALLVGGGTLWIDHFELLIDGKPFTEAPPAKTYAAVLDKEFDGGSKVALGPGLPLSPELTADLVTLGKVWGFVKYHHPAVAEGNYNMDYELFRVATPYIAAKTGAERQKVMLNWVNRFGPVKTISPASVPADAALKPALGWISQAGLGKALAAKLDSIRMAVRTDEHYYIGLFPGVGNPDFKNENDYAQMAYPDAGFRLLGLFRYWNMIEYYFPYKSLIKENWDSVLKESVPRFVTAKDETDYKLAALALLARVQDGHAQLYGRHEALEKRFGKNYAPVQLSLVEGKPVVTDYYNAQLGERSGLQKGDVIESVNGKSIPDLIRGHAPYTPASNPSSQLRQLATNLLRSNDSTLSISFKRNGKIQKADLKLFDSKQINIYANYNKKDTCFKMLRPDIAYIFPGKYKNNYLPVLAPQVLKAKGLVIDMRCYPSDFMVFTLGEHLMPEPRSFAKFTHGSLQTPGLFTFTPDVKVGKTNADYYKGKVVVIVNEATVSQSEYTTMAFSAAPNVTVIGSTTAGADGNVSPISLPGGIRTGISGIGVYYPDGRETQQIGIVPQVKVAPTIRGISEGRDEALEKALEIVSAR